MSTYQSQGGTAKKLLARDLFSVKNNKKYIGKYVTICVINPNRQGHIWKKRYFLCLNNWNSFIKKEERMKN